MTFENLVPITNPGAYTPRIFGFKVHHSSPSLCQVGPKRLSIEPFRNPSDPSATTVSTSATIEHVNGRRSALPFLDKENEDDSDGDYGALPPPRLFSPVTSTVSVSAVPNTRSSQLPRETVPVYGTSPRGVKRDSTGQEVDPRFLSQPLTHLNPRKK